MRRFALYVALLSVIQPQASGEQMDPNEQNALIGSNMLVEERPEAVLAASAVPRLQQSPTFEALSTNDQAEIESFDLSNVDLRPTMQSAQGLCNEYHKQSRTATWDPGRLSELFNAVEQAEQRANEQYLQEFMSRLSPTAHAALTDQLRIIRNGPGQTVRLDMQGLASSSPEAVQAIVASFCSNLEQRYSIEEARFRLKRQELGTGKRAIDMPPGKTLTREEMLELTKMKHGKTQGDNKK